MYDTIIGYLHQAEALAAVAIAVYVGLHIKVFCVAAKSAADTVVGHIGNVFVRNAVKHEIEVVEPIVESQVSKAWNELTDDVKNAAADGTIDKQEWAKVVGDIRDGAVSTAKAVASGILGDLRYVGSSFIGHMAEGKLADKVEVARIAKSVSNPPSPSASTSAAPTDSTSA